MVKVASFLLLFCSFLSESAHALNGFSRACAFAEIPASLRGPALRLFGFIGTSGLTEWDFLLYEPEAKLWRYRINESITTDYGTARYYLYAENRIFYRSSSATSYSFVGEHKSGGWQAETMPSEVYEDSILQVFFHNRSLLYSVRAGNPRIIEDSPARSLGDKYWVVGQHYYYDPVSKVQGFIRTSEATNCNLSQWGFGER